LTWIDWQAGDGALREFVRELISLRVHHPVFRRSKWFRGRGAQEAAVPDIEWFTPEGEAMSTEEWQDAQRKSFAVFLNGEGLSSFDSEGRQDVDDSFCVLVNSYHEALTFRLPTETWGKY